MLNAGFIMMVPFETVKQTGIKYIKKKYNFLKCKL